MKKLYPLLSVLFLIYWGCEDEQPEEVDTTPPTVSISSHSSGQSVNLIITISVTTQDNDGISKVEFYIDDSLFFTDSESPYQYDWNTTQYEDNSEHIIKVISYDNSDNSTESQPIMLIVDNRVYLWGVYYLIENTDSLNLSNSGLTGSIPPEIGNLTNLTQLYLFDNQLTGEIPPEIGNLTNLTYLRLSSNQLTGSIPSETENLTNLTDLDLGSNQLTGELPPEIGNLTNLTVLSLTGNELTGSIPPELGNLTNLTGLGLGYNQLTGEIPPVIGNLTNLTGLELSGNQLTGSIPSEIGNLSNLKGLILSENQLTGSIPPEIGNLTNLIGLWLYDNQLTGEIPESICDLNLNWINPYNFNISNNQLCPPYPSCIEDYVGNQDTSDCD
jgi:Leucine-rich repeat (LRR) protein